MAQDVIEYASAVRQEGAQLGRRSLARLSLRLAVGVAAGQAVFAGLVCLGRLGERNLPPVIGAAVGFVAVALAFAMAVTWVSTVALTLAAWADRDGPTRTAATALIILAAEAAAVPGIASLLFH